MSDQSSVGPDFNHLTNAYPTGCLPSAVYLAYYKAKTQQSTRAMTDVAAMNAEDVKMLSTTVKPVGAKLTSVATSGYDKASAIMASV